MEKTQYCPFKLYIYKQLSWFAEYQMRSAPLSVEEKIRFYHRYVEAFKFANGLKRHIRDPHFKADKVSIKLNIQCMCS